MKKINEIFYSLQGEGCHAGVPSIFVRFSGCNKKCFFCDTPHQKGREMTDEEIIAEVNSYPANRIILTGGEPALWIDHNFIAKLKKETDKLIAIETNGSLPVPDNIDWITISPKCGMEGAGDYEILIEKSDEMKVVDIGQDLEPYFSYPCVVPTTVMLLQPCFVDDPKQFSSNVSSTIGRVLSDPRWRLSMQIHRFLGIR